MTNTLDTALEFFGKITASISHEAKNSLAVMNENTGLLQDLLFLAEKGQPLEIEKVKSIAERTIRQIERSNLIFQNMNKFAHTADISFGEFDLNIALELLVLLSQRTASVKGATIIYQKSSTPIIIKSRPIVLQSLIFSILNFMMEGKNSIEIFANKTENNISILLKSERELTFEQFPNDKEKNLIEVLNAQIITNANEIAIIVNNDSL